MQVEQLREVWRDAELARMLNAADVAVPVHPVHAEESLAAALELMDQDDVDALPVMGREGLVLGLLSRSAIRQHLRRQRALEPAASRGAVAPTEV